MYKEAIDNWTLVMDNFGWTEEAGRVRQACDATDPTRAVQQLSKEFDNIAKSRWVQPSVMIEFYSALKDQEHTLTWLERGIAVHEWDAVFSLGDPDFDDFRSDPRFQELVRRAGLPP
jgi:hypothetical protein